ncbi:MAG: YezD family protein [Candidatus Omnitrophica bacterium]|nr:YezD family protein [Candidatus Omnitrophota bacterium]MBI2173712.1 YezD family protein [Candidatus Omnitrophota bacterium]MBI3009913.1 YezD family protein [Candidatus Omnitrophota bacterium]
MAKTVCHLSEGLIVQIAEAINSIRYGTVQITIHDCRVVQIEKSERIRLNSDADLTTGGLDEHVSRADRTTGSPRLALGR